MAAGIVLLQDNEEVRSLKMIFAALSVLFPLLSATDYPAEKRFLDLLLIILC